MTIRMLAMAATVSLLAACSAKVPPSFGEQLADKSAATGVIAKKWQVAEAQRNKGVRLMEKGNKNLAAAQQDMSDANRDIQKAQQMVMDAEVAMRAAEEEMHAFRAGKLIDIPNTPLSVMPRADNP